MIKMQVICIRPHDIVYPGVLRVRAGGGLKLFFLLKSFVLFFCVPLPCGHGKRTWDPRTGGTVRGYSSREGRVPVKNWPNGFDPDSIVLVHF
jgi:hypothetical protein